MPRGRPRMYQLPAFEEYLIQQGDLGPQTIRTYIRCVHKIINRVGLYPTETQVRDCIMIDLKTEANGRTAWNTYVEFVQVTQADKSNMPALLPVLDDRLRNMQFTPQHSLYVQALKMFVDQTNASVMDIKNLSTQDIRLINRNNKSFDFDLIKVRLLHPLRVAWVELDLQDEISIELYKRVELYYGLACYYKNALTPVFPNYNSDDKPERMTESEIFRIAKGAAITFRPERVAPKIISMTNVAYSAQLSQWQELPKYSALFQWMNDRLAWNAVKWYWENSLEGQAWEVRSEVIANETEDLLDKRL